MSRWTVVIAGLAGLVALAGCATITRGTSEVLVVNSEPGGAEVEISDGHRCRTPCSVELKRKHDYHVVVEKPGFERIDADVRSQIVNAGAAGMAGNVLLGGLIGAGVDASTGATRGLTPNPLEVRLVPVQAPGGSTTPALPAASPSATGRAPVSLQDVPVEPICDQPEKVDRAVCRGRLRIGMTRDEVLAALGPPVARTEDDARLRYGEHLLVFDGQGRLARIEAPPAD